MDDADGNADPFDCRQNIFVKYTKHGHARWKKQGDGYAFSCLFFWKQGQKTGRRKGNWKEKGMEII